MPPEMLTRIIIEISIAITFAVRIIDKAQRHRRKRIHTDQLARLSGLHRRGWLALLALLAAGPARAADRNEIRAVEAAATNGAVELVIQGSRAPSYTVFKLQDPPRLVVDLTGADVSKVAPLQVGQGGVLAVTTAQYQDDKNAVGRVIVALDGPREYEVAPRGDAVVVRVLDDKATAAVTAPAPVEPEPVPGEEACFGVRFTAPDAGRPVRVHSLAVHRGASTVVLVGRVGP